MLLELPWSMSTVRGKLVPKTFQGALTRCLSSISSTSWPSHYPRYPRLAHFTSPQPSCLEMLAGAKAGRLELLEAELFMDGFI